MKKLIICMNYEEEGSKFQDLKQELMQLER